MILNQKAASSTVSRHSAQKRRDTSLKVVDKDKGMKTLGGMSIK